MRNVDVFSARELRNNTAALIKDAENGCLSLITKRGIPMILAVPFDTQLLNLGVNKSIALYLFEKKIITLSQAAKVARLSISDFLDLLKETDIDVVDYPVQEVDTDLANIL